MRWIHSSVRALLNCLWYMMMRLRWLMIAVLLLALHFLVGVPIWLFWLALGLWAVYVLLLALFVRFANYCGNLPKVSRPNINPYSSRSADMLPRDGDEKEADFKEI